MYNIRLKRTNHLFLLLFLYLLLSFFVKIKDKINQRVMSLISQRSWILFGINCGKCSMRNRLNF